MPHRRRCKSCKQWHLTTETCYWGQSRPERNKILHEQRQQAAGANRVNKPSKSQLRRRAIQEQVEKGEEGG